MMPRVPATAWPSLVIAIASAIAAVHAHATRLRPPGARPENRPAHTERHAIYYGHAQPSGTRIPDGAVRAITADVARRLAGR